MNVLVLGASGMIGSTMLRVLAGKPEWRVMGAVRGKDAPRSLSGATLIAGVDLADPDQLSHLMFEAKPQVIINCAGLTKHLPGGNDPLPAMVMNSMLPHRLVRLCALAGARLIHVSTDCVFSGKGGNYREEDVPDAADVYGRTKQLGEVIGPNVITLRTSTIGHELSTRFGLLEWFLAQQRCRGYRRAVFSGLSTLEFARVVREFVIPNTELTGLYHVGGEAIDKLSLLRLIARIYGLQTEIIPDDEVEVDRSLNSNRFRTETGYRAPGWTSLVEGMYQDWKRQRERDV